MASCRLRSAFSSSLKTSSFLSPNLQQGRCSTSFGLSRSSALLRRSCAQPTSIIEDLWDHSQVFQAEARIGPGLGPGGAERSDDRSRVHRHHVGGEHQPMALSTMGSSLRPDQPGALGRSSSSHPQDRSLCRLRIRQPCLFLRLAADASPHGGKALDPLAASFGSGGALHSMVAISTSTIRASCPAGRVRRSTSPLIYAEPLSFSFFCWRSFSCSPAA